jgi:ribonuclease HII
MASTLTGPSLKRERELFAAGVGLVAGMDEVGRGAFGGPVSVGVCVVNPNVGPIPAGLKDSKLMTAVARDKMVPLVEQWAMACAVGDAEASEIDELGIVGALRLAGMRALEKLPVQPDVIILDGSHDWLSPDVSDLFSEPVDFSARVEMKVKADQTIACVAGASVVAKVHRDSLMRHLDATYPGYGWAAHVGYGTPAHREAIAKLGLSAAHRKSWKLEG